MEPRQVNIYQISYTRTMVNVNKGLKNINIKYRVFPSSANLSIYLKYSLPAITICGHNA